jgi:hypothetical protein
MAFLAQTLGIFKVLAANFSIWVLPSAPLIFMFHWRTSLVATVKLQFSDLEVTGSNPGNVSLEDEPCCNGEVAI